MTSTTSATTGAELAPLFEPLGFGRRSARNRIVQAPMSVGYANPDGTVTEREVETTPGAPRAAPA
ncbi:hypothetical protein O1M54_02065 [Streptomyces diastatochromogenes]|nr:hypothetical protein [Streptomyces diastatochromogenes]